MIENSSDGEKMYQILTFTPIIKCRVSELLKCLYASAKWAKNTHQSRIAEGRRKKNLAPRFNLFNTYTISYNIITIIFHNLLAIINAEVNVYKGLKMSFRFTSKCKHCINRRCMQIEEELYKSDDKAVKEILRNIVHFYKLLYILV